MLILYNLLQIFLLLLFFPLILIYIAVKAKYRTHIPARLGLGLEKAVRNLNPSKKTVWIHALSVGEVTSAQQLMKRLARERKDLNLVFSASTRTGLELARKRLSGYCTLILAYPLDILPVATRYIHSIKPDIFILVETDFWPNFLTTLCRNKIPALLFNGRISEGSLQKYKRFSFFFSPLFHSFHTLCVQTERDRQRLTELGVPLQKIVKMGNLKFEYVPTQNSRNAEITVKNRKGTILVAGSTHPGEEEILLKSYIQLREKYKLSLILAPRDTGRTREIISLAETHGLSYQLLTSQKSFTEDLLIIDTIGDLTSFYAHCHISFVGGSLVDEGGHNPLEPASFSKPVLYGPYMSDFYEIANELYDCGGGIKLNGPAELTSTLSELLEEPEMAKHYGLAAGKYSQKIVGLLDKHIDLIKDTLHRRT